MSILKTAFIIALLSAIVAFAIVPFEDYGPKSTLTYRPIPEPASFGLTGELPGGETLTESPCFYRLDPITGKASLLTGYPQRIEGFQAIDEASAGVALLGFIDSHRELFGVSSQDLEITSVEWVRGRATVGLRQMFEGLPVWGTNLAAIITPDAKISYISNRLIPEIEVFGAASIGEAEGLANALRALDPKGQPRRIDKLGEFVFPVWQKDGYEAHRAWVFRVFCDDPIGLWQIAVSSNSGQILAISNELRTIEHSGKVSGQYHPEFKDDPLETSDWFFARVRLNSSVNVFADVAGNWVLDIDVAAPTYNTTHYGRYADVQNDAGARASFTAASFTSPYHFTWTTATSPDDEMNAYYHTNAMHNYVKDTLGFTSMDYSMVTTVNYSVMADNANWDGSGINFGGGETVFYDMALFCDVIYHEYTHGVTHYIYPSGGLPYSGQSGAIDEALSDYFACSKTDNPLMGDGGLYRGSTAYMRRVNGPKVYPIDFLNEVHADGEIISPCWWSIREELGRAFTDSLVHLARFLYPEDFEAFFWATVNIDDDDGNILNGTPNGRLIYESYFEHGIGPGFNLEVSHRPLKNTEATTGTYRVEATFNATLGVSAESIGVFWRVGGGEFSRLSMVDVFGVHKAYIPAQPHGSVINYYIAASDNGGNPMSSPVGAPTSWHTFAVRIDSTAPSVVAMPVGPWFQFAWPPKWELTITDDQSIGSATIGGRIRGVELTPTVLTETSVWDKWAGNLPGMPDGGDTLEYWATAIDNSAARHTTIYPPSGFFRLYVYPGYLEDFEITGRGYSSNAIRAGYIDQWNRVPQNNPMSAGDYCFFFGSGTAYTDLADGALSTPDLNIGSVAWLKFWHTIDAEMDGSYQAWDGGIVEVSTDGGENWQQVEPLPGYNRTIRSNPASPFAAGTRCYSGNISWRKDSLDLAPFSPKARVRFHFGSDARVTGGGWFIDDIELVTNISEIAEGLFKPSELSLHLAPNPFNAALTIEFTPTSESMKIEIFNISGRILRDFEFGIEQNRIVWDGRDQSGAQMPAGIYLVRISDGKTYKTHKAALIK